MPGAVSTLAWDEATPRGRWGVHPRRVGRTSRRDAANPRKAHSGSTEASALGRPVVRLQRCARPRGRLGSLDRFELPVSGRAAVGHHLWLEQETTATRRLPMTARSIVTLTLALAVAAPASALGRSERAVDAPALSLSGRHAAHDKRGQARPDPVPSPSRRGGSTVARIVAPTFARVRPKAARRGWPLSAQTAGDAVTLAAVAISRELRPDH